MNKPKSQDSHLAEISNDGEPTLKYSLSMQKVNFMRHSDTGSDYEIRIGVEGNIGYSTDINISLSGHGISLVLRVRTPEIKGSNRRYPNWLGLICSRGY